MPLTSVPDIMRSLGFYPSEFEITNITNEVKFSSYLTTKKYTTTVDLDTFIRCVQSKTKKEKEKKRRRRKRGRREEIAKEKRQRK